MSKIKKGPASCDAGLFLRRQDQMIAFMIHINEFRPSDFRFVNICCQLYKM